MCAICDGATYEEVWLHMIDQIQKRGYYIQYVGETDDRNPSFAYTVGLSLLNHPEFIVFSMHPDCAVSALEPLVDAVMDGRRFDEGDDPSDLYPFDEPAALLRFPDSSTHLFVANDLFRPPGAAPIPALQLFWPGEVPLLRRHGQPPAPRPVRRRRRRPRNR
jgi:hypothetical protein